MFPMFVSASKLLFSAHISYGKGKYLNQTVFFTKFAKHEIYIKLLRITL